MDETLYPHEWLMKHSDTFAWVFVVLVVVISIYVFPTIVMTAPNVADCHPTALSVSGSSPLMIINGLFLMAIGFFVSLCAYYGDETQCLVKIVKEWKRC